LSEVLTGADPGRQGVRVSDDPTIGFLKADVARFCAGLDDLAPLPGVRTRTTSHHDANVAG
ncbi:hypothetical protein, partial [Streptomyces caniscabiei]|uniref:hypothetical protein n=1 Tax=Streptomyces caniscabiei TaxID=2746961 RepID=UPI001C4FAA77